MNVVKQLSMLLLIFGLMGCSSTGVNAAKDSPQDVVAKRVQLRWDALIKGDLDKAYEYLSPGTRSAMSLELYKAKIRSGGWKKASVDSVVCVRERCDVGVKVEYSYRDMKSIETYVSEVWLLDDGEWWHVLKK